MEKLSNIIIGWEMETQLKHGIKPRVKITTRQTPDDLTFDRKRKLTAHCSAGSNYVWLRCSSVLPPCYRFYYYFYLLLFSVKNQYVLLKGNIFPLRFSLFSKFGPLGTVWKIVVETATAGYNTRRRKRPCKFNRPQIEPKVKIFKTSWYN